MVLEGWGFKPFGRPKIGVLPCPYHPGYFYSIRCYRDYREQLCGTFLEPRRSQVGQSKVVI
jgi:hypothetical protein